jgi:hypothetical protein
MPSAQSDNANPADFPPDIHGIIRAAALEAAEATASRFGAILPIPRTWATDREVEKYLGWRPGTLASKRNRGEAVPTSYGAGKQRRTRLADVDDFIVNRSQVVTARSEG